MIIPPIIQKQVEMALLPSGTRSARSRLGYLYSRSVKRSQLPVGSGQTVLEQIPSLQPYYDVTTIDEIIQDLWVSPHVDEAPLAPLLFANPIVGAEELSLLHDFNHNEVNKYFTSGSMAARFALRHNPNNYDFLVADENDISILDIFIIQDTIFQIIYDLFLVTMEQDVSHLDPDEHKARTFVVRPEKKVQLVNWIRSVVLTRPLRQADETYFEEKISSLMNDESGRYIGMMGTLFGRILRVIKKEYACFAEENAALLALVRSLEKATGIGPKTYAMDKLFLASHVGDHESAPLPRAEVQVRSRRG